MKNKLFSIFILLSVLLPLYSKGLSSDEVEDVKTEPAAVEVSADVESGTESQDFEELYDSLNKAGFDTPTGDVLPSIDFELPGLDGMNHKLSDYKGKVVFLNFWATWCGPCRSEMPSMENLYNELKDEGFAVLAVDLGEERETVQEFADELGLTFPIVLDQTNQVGASYDARSIPTTYLIGKDGNILGRAIGARLWEDESYIKLFRDILNM